MEQQVDFSKYQVVALTNGKEIIIKNFSTVEIATDTFHIKCVGIFTANHLGNNWVNLTINEVNILYFRDLFDSEKRIVRRVEDSSK